MYSYIGSDSKYNDNIYNSIPTFSLKFDNISSFFDKEYSDIFNWNNMDYIFNDTFTQTTNIYTSSIISGSLFNEIYKNTKFVKLTNESCIHHYYQYTEGLNIDYKNFGTDTKYGLYFCMIDNICELNKYYHEPLTYIWDVTIPSDAQVVIYNNKFKTDRFILSNKMPIIEYIYSKVVCMLSDLNIHIDDIITYIMNIPSNFVPHKYMDEIWQAVILRKPEAIKDIPKEYKTYNVCLYAAQNYDDAYDYIIDVCDGSRVIIMECVNKNPNIFIKLDEIYKTEQISMIAYRHNNKLYEYIPNKYKTLEMSIQYLQNPENTIFNVCPEHINNIELINKVISQNGLFLYNVPYKFKTKQLCIEAVRNNGNSLNFVPLSIIDYDICLIAINNTAEAYDYIPELYRDIKLNEFYVAKYMYTITKIEPNKVTHNMILSILKDQFLDAYIKDINFENINIRSLFIEHFKEYVDFNNVIVNYLPFDLIYEKRGNMYYAVKLNINIFLDNYEKFDFKFSVIMVKEGANFCYLPSHKITLELLDELIIARMSIINELPIKYLHDGLYKICMKVHGMKYEDIPEEFRTETILHTAHQLYPDEFNFATFLEKNKINNNVNILNTAMCDYDSNGVFLIEKVL